MLTSHHCKGCITPDDGPDFDGCPYTEYNIEGACPCTICVVKTMCGDPCPEYEKWIRDKGVWGIKNE